MQLQMDFGVLFEIWQTLYVCPKANANANAQFAFIFELCHNIGVYK